MRPSAGPMSAVPESERERAVDVVRELAVGGRLEPDALERAIERLLGAATDDDVAAVVASLPAPVAFTAPSRRLSEPLQLRAGMRGLTLRGHWQLAAQTSVRAELGRVHIDLTEATFDARTVDLTVYTGWGRVTIVVPRGLGVQVVRHHGTLRSEIDPPLPGAPLVRLDVRTNIGSVRLRHP